MLPQLQTLELLLSFPQGGELQEPTRTTVVPFHASVPEWYVSQQMSGAPPQADWGCGGPHRRTRLMQVEKGRDPSRWRRGSTLGHASTRQYDTDMMNDGI